MSKMTALTIVIASILVVWGGASAASLVSSGASGGTGCVSPPSGMAAWWPLDETTGATVVTDISGGGHNGTPQQAPVGPIGPPPSGPAPGVSPQLVPPAMVGGSLYFYGNPIFVQVPHQASLEPGSGDFSIDGWVYPIQVGPGQVQPIVDKFDASTNMGYALYIQSPGGVNNARLNFAYGDGSVNLLVPSIAPIAYTQWHHVAVTVKRTLSPPPGGKYLEVQLYVDGVAQGNQQVGNPVGSIATNLDLLIGGTRISPSQGYGEIGIDEVQMFNRALTPAEIADIQHAGSAGKCTPTPTATPCGAVGAICTPTPTATVTPHSDEPTATATPCGAVGAICTPTPTVTPHSDVPTATATPCGAVGAICTATPTRTSTPHSDVPTATATRPPTRTATRTPTPHKACGDVNDDGRVNSIDANLVLQLAAGRIAQLPNFASADTNHDGGVNAIDATVILQMDAGFLQALQCG